MSPIDEPGSPPPDTLEPANYVAFLEHWAAEFPTAKARSGAGDDAADRHLGDVPALEAAQAGANFAVPPPFPPEPGTGRVARGEPGPLRLPRRREATESLRVRLAPEHLYWLRLTAARTGAKVDESVLVAAGLMLLAERAIDWRAMRSRRDLRAALASTPPPPPPSWRGVPPVEP